VTQLVSDASGLGCSAQAVGPVMGSPVTHQGDVVGQVPQVWYNGKESSTTSHCSAHPFSSFCQVTSALAWVRVWPWHTVWEPRAVHSELLPLFSVRRNACVQTRLDLASLWGLEAVAAEGIMMKDIFYLHSK